MPLDLTNLTASIVNVPFNAGNKPVYVVAPGETVRVAEEYLLSLTAEAQARLLSVTSGPNPLFSAVVVSEVEPVEVFTDEEKDLLALGIPLVEQAPKPQRVTEDPTRVKRRRGK